MILFSAVYTYAPSFHSFSIFQPFSFCTLFSFLLLILIHLSLYFFFPAFLHSFSFTFFLQLFSSMSHFFAKWQTFFLYPLISFLFFCHAFSLFDLFNFFITQLFLYPSFMLVFFSDILPSFTLFYLFDFTPQHDQFDIYFAAKNGSHTIKWHFNFLIKIMSNQ